MSVNQFSRTEMLLGKGFTEKVSKKKVILFGLGGVGSYAAEALARAGIGSITLVDSDRVSLTNLNRQLCALHSTVGRYKTEVVAERILDINPSCRVECINEFYLPENSDSFGLEKYDFILDAVDTVSAKINLAVKGEEKGVPVISCMGTGNKLDPTLFRVSDIYETTFCPLCRVMRNELKKRGVSKLRVVWSPEEPMKPGEPEEETNKRSLPGSAPFVPGAAGLIMAGEVIKYFRG